MLKKSLYIEAEFKFFYKTPYKISDSLRFSTKTRSRFCHFGRMGYNIDKKT